MLQGVAVVLCEDCNSKLHFMQAFRKPLSLLPVFLPALCQSWTILSIYQELRRATQYSSEYFRGVDR